MVNSAAFIIFSSFLLFDIHAAVIKDEALKRVARSPHCGVCEDNGPPHHPPPPPPPPGFPHPPPPPPPPPPFFRTQQWSGLTRSSDGTQQGVFSGAAAAAEGESQANGEAFSVASSGISNGVKGGQSAGGRGDSGHEEQSFGSQGSQSNAQFGTKNGYSGNGHQSTHNVESLEQSNLGASSERGDQGQEQFGKYGSGSQASSQSNAFSGNSQQQSHEGGRETSSQYHANDREEQHQNSRSHYGQLQSGSGGSSGSGQSSSQGLVDAQSTLNGALNLASQGQQSSPPSGCSTCGKSSYALSNAKSHSGSAVAISVGGK